MGTEGPPALRSWDHPINGICPYFTMFPLAFPLDVLAEAKPGDRALDPFCGRGTTSLASRILGLPSVGIDSNPVAVAIARAKLVDTSPGDVIAAAQRVLEEVASPASVPEGAFWSLAFHRDVLTIVCRLREGLMRDCTSPERIALRALLLGALHGPKNKRTLTYLSNQSQRTYAPKPAYAVKFWTERQLEPPEVDVLGVIERRAYRYFADLPPGTSGRIAEGDSRCSETMAQACDQPVRWIVTSPPYYGLRTYLPDQWLRWWFLGGPPSVDYGNGAQLSHSGVDGFVNDLAAVWTNVRSVATLDARLVVRFGAINDRRVEPLDLLRASFAASGWTVAEERSAGTAARGRRQAGHATGKVNEPLEEFDVVAVRSI